MKRQGQKSLTLHPQETLYPVSLPTAKRKTALRARCILFALLLSLLSLYALSLGDIRLSLGETFSALQGEGSKAHQMVVWQWRAPRVLAALILGAALGLSGAIFQRLTRNPLGSPDIVGFNTGSFTGVVLATVLGWSGGFLGQGGSAIIGGLLTAGLVYALAYKNGLQSFRFIVVGIAVSAFFTSINTWFMTYYDLSTTFEASIWGAGSLLFVSWDSLLPASTFIIILIILCLPARRALAQLELGDDIAASSGVAVEKTRGLLIALGIMLTATVTAVAGPIAFIALAAPHLALYLAPQKYFSLSLTALTGAFLLLTSDMLAQHAITNVVLPTGAVTITLGGAYLVWLLARSSGNSR